MSGDSTYHVETLDVWWMMERDNSKMENQHWPASTTPGDGRIKTAFSADEWNALLEMILPKAVVMISALTFLI